eukprot:6697301-Alexandrium_andersonii.AAC.1
MSFIRSVLRRAASSALPGLSPSTEPQHPNAGSRVSTNGASERPGQQCCFSHTCACIQNRPCCGAPGELPQRR